jgi:hypothetical protein
MIKGKGARIRTVSEVLNLINEEICLRNNLFVTFYFFYSFPENSS